MKTSTLHARFAPVATRERCAWWSNGWICVDQITLMIPPSTMPIPNGRSRISQSPRSPRKMSAPPRQMRERAENWRNRRPSPATYDHIS